MKAEDNKIVLFVCIIHFYSYDDTLVAIPVPVPCIITVTMASMSFIHSFIQGVWWSHLLIVLGCVHFLIARCRCCCLLFGDKLSGSILGWQRAPSSKTMVGTYHLDFVVKFLFAPSFSPYRRHPTKSNFHGLVFVFQLSGLHHQCCSMASWLHPLNCHHSPHQECV